MNHVIKSAIPIIAIFILSGCGTGSNKNMDMQDKSNSGEQNSMEMNNTASSGASLKDDKLNAVYQHYVHLTNALIKEDVAEAKVAASAIEAGAKDVNGVEKIAASAAKITAAADIEAQRNEYSDLSNELIRIVKKSGLKSGELYIDYCPMALHNKGAYWLSSGKEIRNPYFGDKMLSCGEVKETLK
jgi:hypothetical protein